MDDIGERVDILEQRTKDLIRIILYMAKQTRVLDPGLCDRCLESLNTIG